MSSTDYLLLPSLLSGINLPHIMLFQTAFYKDLIENQNFHPILQTQISVSVKLLMLYLILTGFRLQRWLAQCNFVHMPSLESTTQEAYRRNRANKWGHECVHCCEHIFQSKFNTISAPIKRFRRRLQLIFHQFFRFYRVRYWMLSFVFRSLLQTPDILKIIAFTKFNATNT